MGEHADARELASLYISKGVPIYPAPRGHAYHTLAWRMGLELSSSTTTTSTVGEDGRREENDGQRTGNVSNPVTAAVASAATLDGAEERMRIGTDDEIIVGVINANESIALLPPPIMDAYYSSRYLDGADDGSITNDMHRNNVGDGGAGQRRPPNGRGRNRRRNRHNTIHSLREQITSMTYVEEKALFWKRKKGIEEEGSSSTLTTAATPTSRPFAPRQPLLHHVPPLLNHDAAIAAPQAAPMGIAASSSSLLSNSVPDLRSLVVEELSVLEHEHNNIMPLYAPSATHVPSPSSPPSHHLRRHATMIMHDVVVAPKLTMRVHRHLADQHFFGSPSVDDEKGGMIAGEFGRRNGV